MRLSADLNPFKSHQRGTVCITDHSTLAQITYLNSVVMPDEEPNEESAQESADDGEESD